MAFQEGLKIHLLQPLDPQAADWEAQKVAYGLRVARKIAGAALEALLDTITKDLKKGNNVVITGFGTFRVSKRGARTGVNPRNPKEKIKIPAMKVAAFKAGKALKEAVR